jgi:hypothetical protein
MARPVHDTVGGSFHVKTNSASQYTAALRVYIDESHGGWLSGSGTITSKSGSIDMSRYLRFVQLGVSCALMLGIAATFARGDSTTTPATSSNGTITGTVAGVNGPTAGVSIKVYAYTGKHSKGEKTSTTGKHAKRTPVAEGTTDAKGAFTLSNVPAGNYIVMATLKGVGRGHATADLTSTTVSVSISLKAAHAKKSQ